MGSCGPRRDIEGRPEVVGIARRAEVRLLLSFFAWSSASWFRSRRTLAEILTANGFNTRKLLSALLQRESDCRGTITSVGPIEAGVSLGLIVYLPAETVYSTGADWWRIGICRSSVSSGTRF